MPGSETDTDEIDGVDELYGLPLEEFTPARNTLSKRLRASGDKPGAARVQKLRKPTITAWALNQLARRHPDGITALLESGAALRAAHEQALQGDASALRPATRKNQQDVADLASRAAAILDEAGSSGAANLERLTESLRAAATDRVAADDLRSGRVTTDLEASGFGFGDGARMPVPTPLRSSGDGRDQAPEREDGAGDDRTAEHRAAAAEERAAADRAAAERAAAEQAVKTARRAVDQLQRDVRASRERAERLIHEAERAERVAADARARADEAAAALAEHEERLREATAAAEEAQKLLD